MEIDPTIIFFWRAVERLVDVLIGGLAIYLGYKLFINLPERPRDEKGEMKMWLPGGISVYASRIGPGVFFALFGTAVVLMSFASPLITTSGLDPRFEKASDNAQAVARKTEPAAGRPLSISYNTGEVDADRFSVDRAVVKRDLAMVRELEARLMTFVDTGNWPGMTASDANTLINALQRIKRALLLDVWDPAWGDAQAFSNWVQQGAIGSPPPGMQEAAAIFKTTPREVSP